MPDKNSKPTTLRKAVAKMSSGIDWARLSAPFAPSEIEWRIQEAGKTKEGKVWAKCFAYVTNRAIMDRLDEVAGPQNWKNEYKAGPAGGVLCGLSIRFDEEWITKWDGADNPEIEAVKGGLSNAMKRAAVQWGLGRYLYGLDVYFAEIVANGRFFSRLPRDKGGDSFKWNPPALPAWATPQNYQPPPTEQLDPGESPPSPEPPEVANAVSAIRNAKSVSDLERYAEVIDGRKAKGRYTADEHKRLELEIETRRRALTPDEISEEENTLFLLKDKLDKAALPLEVENARRWFADKQVGDATRKKGEELIAEVDKEIAEQPA